MSQPKTSPATASMTELPADRMENAIAGEIIRNLPPINGGNTAIFALPLNRPSPVVAACHQALILQQRTVMRVSASSPSLPQTLQKQAPMDLWIEAGALRGVMRQWRPDLDRLQRLVVVAFSPAQITPTLLERAISPDRCAVFYAVKDTAVFMVFDPLTATYRLPQTLYSTALQGETLRAAAAADARHLFNGRIPEVGMDLPGRWVQSTAANGYAPVSAPQRDMSLREQVEDGVRAFFSQRGMDESYAQLDLIPQRMAGLDSIQVLRLVSDLEREFEVKLKFELLWTDDTFSLQKLKDQVVTLAERRRASPKAEASPSRPRELSFPRT